MKYLLECRNVAKTYRTGGTFSLSRPKTVLRGADLFVEKGRSFGLLGRNGSGKSTLSRIILGLEKADAGEVRFDSRPVSDFIKKDEQAFRRRVQAVFQDAASALNPRFSAWEAVTEPLYNFTSLNRRELKERALSLMETVGLDPRQADKPTCLFSGGEQQRLCIARSIASEPELVILDEAVSGLDMLVQHRITELLKTLSRERGITYLVISHDMRVIFRLCEDAAVLENGVVTDRLKIEEGYGKARGGAFRALLDAVPSEPAF